MSAVEVVFVLLGALAVGSALLVAVSDNLVNCALWLVVTLGSLAGGYLLLAAEFVAWVLPARCAAHRRNRLPVADNMQRNLRSLYMFTGSAKFFRITGSPHRPGRSGDL